ncbi:MAG: VOC family protein [Myxococcota bacterium]
MKNIGQSFGRIVQVAYLVEDIETAISNWLAQAGLGPWTWFRNIELETDFDGQNFTMHIDEALAYMGNLQIQLVQSLDPVETATPYQEHLRARRFGVHHSAFFAEDFDATLAQAQAQGFERTCLMRDKAGFRYAYCQSSSMPDVWIEFLESYPFLTKIFEEGIAAAANWDGTEPVKVFEYKDL